MMNQKTVRSLTAALTLLCLLFLAGSVPAQSPLQITGVEVNQVLGVQKDNHQYFVAGKQTAVRAFLSEPVAIDSARTIVQVFKGGREAFRIKPKATTDSVSTVDFICDSLDACGKWSAGTYAFEVAVNGISAPKTASYTFAAGTPLRILAVAVKANYGKGGAVSVSGTKWKNMGKFMQNVYPLAEENFKWSVHPTVLDASGAAFNLTKSDWSGCRNLSNALSRMIPASCGANPQGAGCYDYVVGFIDKSLVMDNGDDLAGFAYTGTKAVVAVAGDDDAPGTIAHEIAHQFGIGDTYDDAKLSSIRCSVNPAPDGFEGRDWDNNLETVTSCKEGRPPSTLIGSNNKTVSGAQVPASAHPFEVRGRGSLPEMADFMSAGSVWQKQLWITQDTYDWLYRRLVKQEQGLSQVRRDMRASDSVQRFVSFSGFLGKTGGVELNPWRSFTDKIDLADTTGNLMVRAVNDTGTVVAGTAFTVQFFMVHPPRTLDRAPFSGVIRFPADTVKFQIVQNGQVLAESPVSANPPTVANVTPRASTTIDGLYTISWQGGDADGTSPTYTVLYNRDVTQAASPWMTLAEGLAVLTWREDFSLLPGGAHARIQVIADDGILSALAESAEFVVPVKKPAVFMDEPPWGTVYKRGSDILLMAEAYDPQDEWLPDSNLKWASSISGDLGYGSELLVRNLPPGVHLITVTAANSAGLTETATVTVRIEDTAGGGSGSCFIATAAFGSSLNPYVGILQTFRDAFLLTNERGRAFVAWYYKASPSMAAFIADKGLLKAAVRALLLPVVGIAALSLKIGFLWAMLLVGALAALTALGVRRATRPAQDRRQP